MKDLVTNRKRINLAHKVRLARLAFLENGLFWTAYCGLYYVGSSVGEWAYARMSRLRARRNLPGVNSPAMNYEIWQNWDWDGRGEEWTQSVTWKHSLIDNVLLRYIPPGGRVLEIGPGAGRWTDALRRVAYHVVAVDISHKCVEICRRRFAAYDNVEFVVNNGSALPSVADGSLDSIWSFDVFVHINAPEVKAYVREFKRVLKPGGVAIIHHGQEGGSRGGWRSDLTSAAFASILEENGFRVITQFSEWKDGELSFSVGRYDDVLTVFEKAN